MLTTHTDAFVATLLCEGGAIAYELVDTVIVTDHGCLKTVYQTHDVNNIMIQDSVHHLILKLERGFILPVVHN
jgi:hypothetical protein